MKEGINIYVNSRPYANGIHVKNVLMRGKFLYYHFLKILT